MLIIFEGQPSTGIISVIEGISSEVCLNSIPIRGGGIVPPPPRYTSSNNSRTPSATELNPSDN